MTDWILPSNPETFDTEGALRDRGVMDWSEASNAHIRSGDRVFIYEVRPTSAIVHCCKVSRTGMSSDEATDDSVHWQNTAALNERRNRTRMRLELLHTFSAVERADLSLDSLQSRGVRGAPQGRQRASAGVSALVDEILASTDLQLTDRLARERDLLHSLGHPRGTWAPSRGQRGGTGSFASYDAALEAPGAPTALAMLRIYLERADLGPDDGWSVSAVPTWVRTQGRQRFATLGGSRGQLFYVWLDSHTGEVRSWGVQLPYRGDPGLPMPEGVQLGKADTGEVTAEGGDMEQLLAFLDEPSVLEVVRSTAAERATATRKDRNNPYLAALLSARPAPEHEPSLPQEPSSEEDVEFERRYIERVTRQRLHQAPLRRAALRRHGSRCMYCGLDVPEILEAAHIVSDSEGGAASTDNILILCANHHTAFDAGLLELVDGELSTAHNAPVVLPGPISRPLGENPA